MEITKSIFGFSIKLPDALNDEFRAAFPSAKWNSTKKTWDVGRGDGSRLEQWAAEVAAAAAEISTLEARLLSEEEIDALREQIDRVRNETANALKKIGDANERKEQLQALQIKLEAEKERFASVSKQLALEKEKARAALDAIYEIVAAVIDLDAIDAARAEMARWHKQVGGVAHAKFNEAQSIIDQQRANLEEAGWGLRGLDYMSVANFNRPDRDHVSFMPATAMTDFYKLED